MIQYSITTFTHTEIKAQKETRNKHKYEIKPENHQHIYKNMCLYIYLYNKLSRICFVLHRFLNELD